MNGWIVFACICAVVAFVSYYLYRGVNDSLVDSTVGSVYSFRYFQPLTGSYDIVLAKVVGKQDMKDYIACLNRNSKYRQYDRSFLRTNTLVTCVLPNGSIRNYYAERADNCKKYFFGKLLYTTGLVTLL